MDIQELKQAYYQMSLIRFFEEEVNRLFEKGLVQGTTHLSIGQEAVPVGTFKALEPGDYATSNHRGHGHLLAKGADSALVMAEILGREGGYCGGRGGSQHIAWIEGHFLGCNGITGGGIPIATGAGLHLWQHNLPGVSVCFFGDGATNQGSFHESLNMAGLWKLPVIYVCENNLYAMSTSLDKSTAATRIANRVSSYNIPGFTIDGNDVEAVYQAVSEAAARARSGEGPTLLEFITYRWLGHSRGDPRLYRSREEEASWREHDPLKLLANRLSESQISKTELDKLTDEAHQAIGSAVEFALASPYPTLPAINS